MEDISSVQDRRHGVAGRLRLCEGLDGPVVAKYVGFAMGSLGSWVAERCPGSDPAPDVGGADGWDHVDHFLRDIVRAVPSPTS